MYFTNPDRIASRPWYYMYHNNNRFIVLQMRANIRAKCDADAWQVSAVAGKIGVAPPAWRIRLYMLYANFILNVSVQRVDINFANPLCSKSSP